MLENHVHSFLCKIKPYIQPFERVLALQELNVLSGCNPEPFEGDSAIEHTTFKIRTDAPLHSLVENLTYWEAIGKNDLQLCLTRQVKREATVNLVRNGIKPAVLRKLLPFVHEAPIQNRRVLRYASHGIHEYRGKFFPQLVRSLLNKAGVYSHATILDSMCGSGTTPVEAILRGCDAIGIDYNPLSVLISQAKCKILSIDPDKLTTEYETLKRDLLSRPQRQRRQKIWFNGLPDSSKKYLANWFSEEALQDLDLIKTRIQKIKNEVVSKFFLLSLSNIIRKISWQKNDDLRVRKDVRLDIDVDVIAKYIAELKKSFGYVISFLYENEGIQIGSARIVSGDARKSNVIIADKAGQIDCIVTSPPYATALPYLDTDRLSLYYFDLFERSKHRKHDLNMIGNREITNGYKKELLEKYQEKKNDIPASITGTIDLIDELNRDSGAGFRRQNLPALLAKYFLDMKSVFETYKQLLRPGAPAYVVVGNNHTIAGGQRIEIETDKYLAELGESIGLTVSDQLPMEMLVSRDIFRKNTGTAETIICFRTNQ